MPIAALVAALLAPGAAADPPVFVPWHRVGGISLGESRSRVEARYGTLNVTQRYGDHVDGYYLLHGTRVLVTFYGRRVGELGFSTPYYRTKSGFGVGSRIPLGRCHRTRTARCEHRWHGFVWNAWRRELPCNCWVKVGRSARSLPPTRRNFLKPWFFINVRHGRVASFYFALRFVD